MTWGPLQGPSLGQLNPLCLLPWGIHCLQPFLGSQSQSRRPHPRPGPGSSAPGVWKSPCPHSDSHPISVTSSGKPSELSSTLIFLQFR